MRKGFSLICIIAAFSCAAQQQPPAITLEQGSAGLGSGSTYRFTDVPRGGTGTNVTFIIRNPRDQNLTVNSIAVGSSGATNFILTNLPAFPATVSPQGSLSFDIVAAFSSCSNHSSSVTVTYNSSESLSFTVRGSGAVMYHTFESTSTVWPWGGSSTVQFTNTQRRRGTNSLQFNADMGNNASGFGVQSEANSWDYDIDPDSINNFLTFWVLDTQGNNSVRVKIFETAGAGGESLELWTAGNAVQNQWTRLSIPFSSLTNIDFHHIDKIEFGEWNIGTYYFDDIQVVNE